MNGQFKVLSPIDFTAEVQKEVLELGLRSGTWKGESDPEYYQEQFLNPRNINIIYKNEEGRISGYILARPHNEIISDYLELDPLLEKSEVPMFYVDHVNVDKSGKLIGMQLIIEMIKEANKKRVLRFSLHCRVINRLSVIINKKFKADTIRRIEKYNDCNDEPFDYMEGNVSL